MRSESPLIRSPRLYPLESEKSFPFPTHGRQLIIDLGIGNRHASSCMHNLHSGTVIGYQRPVHIPWREVGHGRFAVLLTELVTVNRAVPFLNPLPRVELEPPHRWFTRWRVDHFIIRVLIV